MQMAVIIDIIVAAVLILFAVLGWRRGAFKSVIGIVVVVAALIGATVISQQAAPVVTKMMTPIISETIERNFDQALEEFLSSGSAIEEEEAAEAFSAAGLYQKTAEILARDVFAQAAQTGQELATVAAESLVTSVATAVLFLLSFILLLIVLKLVSKVLGLLTAVPGLHLMDAVGGGIFGLVQGCLVLYAVAWAMQFFGYGISETVAEQTQLFRLFATFNPMDLFLGT